MKPLLGCTAVLESTEIHGSSHRARPCLDLLLLQWNGVRIIRTKRGFSSFLSLPATMLRGLHFTHCFQLSAGLSLWAVQNSLSGGAHRSYRGKERDVSAWAQLEGWCAGQCRWGGRRACLSLFFFLLRWGWNNGQWWPEYYWHLPTRRKTPPGRDFVFLLLNSSTMMGAWHTLRVVGTLYYYCIEWLSF